MSGSPTSPVAGRPASVASRRPGWPEIVVGLAVLALVAYGTPPLLRALGVQGMPMALSLSALSGIAGVAGFAAAYALRLRSWSAFGVSRTTLRWLLLGVAGGLVAFVLTRVVSIVLFALGLRPENIQGVYTDAGSAGPWSVVLSLLFLAALTPLGEELVFRGVVLTGLLRYRAPVAIVGTAVIFALMHGLNVVFFAAFIVGIITGLLRWRSRSVWPAVTAHAVNNALSQLVALLLAGAL